MSLEEFLVITNESTTVNVVDSESAEVLSRYDGKNSIDKNLNQCKVLGQYEENGEFFVVIDREQEETTFKVTKENIEKLKLLYRENKETLKEMKSFIKEHGILDNGLSDINETFEMGFNNALELVFTRLGIKLEG